MAFNNYFAEYQMLNKSPLNIQNIFYDTDIDDSQDFFIEDPSYYYNNFMQQLPIYRTTHQIINQISQPPIQYIQQQEEQSIPENNSTQQQNTDSQKEVQIRSFSSSSDIIDKVIKNGRSHLGKRYLSATHGPNTFDCSGYVYSIFNEAGIKVPLNIFQLVKFGQEISSIKDAKIGDMIVTPGSGKSGLHVKVISDIKENGDIYVIEAAGKKTGVVERKLTNTSNIKSIRRFV